jgi:lysophospholipase L1-like esterase
MKRILCYGDSNTWGQSDHETRIDDAKQWPIILQESLGGAYRIIQEGLGGRVAGSFENEKPRYNGQDSFEVVYHSASPVDLVIIALGTNDLKDKYRRTAQNIANDLLWYEKAIGGMSRLSERKNTKLLYICPANFTVSNGYFEASQQLRSTLIEQMRGFEMPILEFDNLVMGSDGVHYAESAHKEVAKSIGQKIKEMKL